MAWKAKAPERQPTAKRFAPVLLSLEEACRQPVPTMSTPAFVADVHLGKLAKRLLLLGFDVCYSNVATTRALYEMAMSQNRVLLSRGTPVGNPGFAFLLIQSEDPDIQLIQVVRHYNLYDHCAPFTRCLVCNGVLAAVPKEAVQSNLQQNTVRYFQAFWQCTACNRIYWNGSHYDRMRKLVEKIKEER